MGRRNDEYFGRLDFRGGNALHESGKEIAKGFSRSGFGLENHVFSGEQKRQHFGLHRGWDGDGPDCQRI